MSPSCKPTDGELAPPFAASLTESLRAFGYDLATALADLADNSVFHDSRNIRLYFHWAGEDSIIAISDDGTGMDEETLVNAMRMGSRNPRDVRHPGDLGRFGLGLKTASFSQCRRVTVFTHQSRGKRLSRCWDIDYIAETNEWRLIKSPSAAAAAFVEKLPNSKSGTIVLWEKLDRLTSHTAVESDSDENAFLARAEQVKVHFSMVFHRLMSGKNRMHFELNSRPLHPWDPFVADEPATQVLPAESLRFHEQPIQVQPYVLPHLSKISQERHQQAAGPKGWNAHQGFYIYRNLRLLVAGDWLGLKGWKQEEHYKLARIQVDLPNSLDAVWEIDVTKSRARPPEALKKELLRIGETTRSRAKHVYSHRGAKLNPSNNSDRVFMWEPIAKHDRIRYRLNRDHPLIQDVQRSCGANSSLGALLRLIEETLPVSLITITDREKPDQTCGPFENAKSSEIYEVIQKVYFSLTSKGMGTNDALLRLSQMDPFQYFPELLERLREDVL